MAKRFFKFTGVTIRIFIYCLLAISTSVIVYTAITVDSITYKQSINYENHLRYLVANAHFRQGTDLLTDAVRRYVVTMSPDFMEDYFREAQQVRHRDMALALVRNLHVDQALKDTLDNALKASTNLMDTEYHAMHLIAMGCDDEMLHSEVRDYQLPPEEQTMSIEERHKQALELLFDENYLKSKVEIYSYLSKGLDLASSQAMEQHQKLRKELIHMLLLSAISMIVFVLSICALVFYRRYQHEQMIEMQAAENARMNAQLKEERDRAIRAEKSRNYFFSTVSHDIRTPLNSIIGFSEMLQLGIDDPEENAKALDAIITSGQTLLELINDVLDLSKIESGKMELHPVPTNIATLVKKVADAFEVATSRTSVPIRTEVGKMPLLTLDPQRIRQILFNLIGNAVKFTVKGSITVRASYDGGTFTLAVADTGCGIAEENIGKLMSPYVQLQKHDDSIGGTGLGLAICKQLSRQMNGTLELESVLGRGSVFTLRIPNVAAGPESEAEAGFVEPEAPAAAAQLDGSIAEQSILVVDDQKLNRRVLQTMLARLGIRKVLTAGNGQEALKVLHDPENVDLVLTDMSMPIMDGAALVREIRKSPRFADLPVCVITADVEMQSQYRQMGFDDMLLKPITLDKLKGLLVKYSPRREPETAAGGDGAQA